MSKTNYWYGYLEAGKKSSPVLRDPSLETGNENTVYLYSLKRDKILEFQAGIVEMKLRDLGEHESDLISSLNAGYKKAKKEFTPRASMRLKQVELTPQAVAEPVKEELDEDIDEAVLDDDLDLAIDMDDD